ncbi:BglG family transcription antiterminator [Helcococcus kunzii]|uniref:BglG family transcription antiterminator n=1 Tax=Helcococcus kunzii TaxID=40091 RepID=UPI0021A38567|nr:BglG family transcription antiterminator [Helcococcus kunzii]MCT1795811.1 BglG family transcription antiterminator [Helcococcus kunzii]MCT1989390.1 BglG family transcription antiterminator [Helcococcus kunzii]
MIQRQKNIIKDLKYSKMSIKEISEKQNVTERTIRNDIKAINEELRPFESELLKNKDGNYFLFINDGKIFNEFEKQELLNFEFDFSEPRDRITYISLRYLFSAKYIKSEEFLDEMFISRSSMQNDMKDVRELLSKYNLDFDVKPNYGLKLVGEEKDIRNAISYLLNKVNENKYYSTIDDFSLIFDKGILKKIYNIIVKNINNSDVKLSDFALNNLVIHIAIAIRRIEINQYFEKKLNNEFTHTSEFEIAKKIVNDIEREFSLDFPIDEVYYITMHLLGTKLILNKNVKTISSKDDIKILDLATKMIKAVDKEMRVNLIKDPELFNSIVQHLKPSIYRYNNNMNIRNPLLSSIKANYPSAFDAAKIASKVIEEELGIKFNEDELGYIAIHLGAAIERDKLNYKIARTLLVCTTGLGSSKLLKYKLESRFSDKIEIVDTTEFYNIDKYRDKSLDLVISTVPFKSQLDVPVIYITDILGDTSFGEIDNFINNFNMSKDFEFLNMNDIYLDLDFSTKEEVLKYLTDEIVKKGKTPESLYESIMEREHIATTSFGNNVAIPHSIEPIAKETFITIGILKNPIIWSDKKVQLIIVLNVAKNTAQNYDSMYKLLLQIIDNDKDVKDLINSNSAKELYDKIVDKIKED